MRESLLEQLKNRELSFIDELRKVYALLNKGARYFYSEAFGKSAFNVFYVDFDEALSRMFKNQNGDYPTDNELGTLIEYTLAKEDELTLNCFLNYLEFFRSLLSWGISSSYGSYAKQISSMILNDCEKLGYEFVEEDNGRTFKVMLKNPEAEAVAAQTNESARDKIYKYLMIREGDVDDKRACIKSLADDVEVVCKTYSNIGEYDKLKQFIQCARHTRDEPKKEFPFYYQDEEKWLDQTFEMIIGILSFTKTKKIVSEIKKLEKQQGHNSAN